MNVESSNVVQNHRSVAGADHRSAKKTGKADLAVNGAASGFSLLMDLLAASDAQTDGSAVAGEATLLAQPEQGGAATPLSVLDRNMPQTLSVSSLIAMNLDSNRGMGVGIASAQLPDVMTVVQGGKAAALTLVGDQKPKENVPAALSVSALIAMNLDSNQGMGVGDTGAQVPDVMTVIEGGKAAALNLGGDPSFKENVPAALTMSALIAMNLDSNQGMGVGSTSAQLPGVMTVVEGGKAAALTLVGDQNNMQNVLPALPESVLAAVNVESGLGLIPAAVEVIGVAFGELGSVQGKTPWLSRLGAATASDKSDMTKLAFSTPTGAVGSEPWLAEQLPQAGLDVPLVRKGPQPLSTMSAVLSELRQSTAHPLRFDLPAASDIGSAMVVSTANQDLLRAQDRLAARPVAHAGAGGEGGLEGASTVNSRVDEPYAIETTSATVADTAVAETVSYWVTHDVQTAELRLDGFGSEPVEVRISLTGDQAQIDFRSNQADVRSVLEAATAQLRDLLSGEGLQLTGVSVGASGSRDAQADARQQRQSTSRQTEVVSEQSVGPLAGRGANPSVGQTLDLFV